MNNQIDNQYGDMEYNPSPELWDYRNGIVVEVDASPNIIIERVGRMQEDPNFSTIKIIIESIGWTKDGLKTVELIRDFGFKLSDSLVIARALSDGNIKFPKDIVGIMNRNNGALLNKGNYIVIDHQIYTKAGNLPMVLPQNVLDSLEDFQVVSEGLILTGDELQRILNIARSDPRIIKEVKEVDKALRQADKGGDWGNILSQLGSEAFVLLSAKYYERFISERLQLGLMYDGPTGVVDYAIEANHSRAEAFTLLTKGPKNRFQALDLYINGAIKMAQYERERTQSLVELTTSKSKDTLLVLGIGGSNIIPLTHAFSNIGVNFEGRDEVVFRDPLTTAVNMVLQRTVLMDLDVKKMDDLRPIYNAISNDPELNYKFDLVLIQNYVLSVMKLSNPDKPSDDVLNYAMQLFKSLTPEDLDALRAASYQGNINQILFQAFNIKGWSLPRK